MHAVPVVSVPPFGFSHIAEARSLWEQSEGVGLGSADEPLALESFLVRNPGLSFVAVHSGHIVGTVLCGHDGRRGYIHHLVVAASMQRQGIGRRLLQRGLEAFRQVGILKCHLLVFRSNESGLAFWRAVGAEDRASVALFSVATRVDDEADR